MLAHNFEVLTPSVSDEEDDGLAPVAPANDQLMCGLCNDCTMDTHEDEDGRQISGSGLAVHICEGCQGGYHSQCIRDDLSAYRTGLRSVMVGPVAGCTSLHVALWRLCRR